MIPITSSGMPNSIRVNSAPSPADGKVEIIVIAWIVLSYSKKRISRASRRYGSAGILSLPPLKIQSHRQDPVSIKARDAW